MENLEAWRPKNFHRRGPANSRKKKDTDMHNENEKENTRGKKD
jgi:hypothetical protein